jgi:hypothetical protein
MRARKPTKAKSPTREFTMSAWWAMLVRSPTAVERRAQARGPRTAGRPASERMSTLSWAFVRLPRQTRR